MATNATTEPPLAWRCNRETNLATPRQFRGIDSFPFGFADRYRAVYDHATRTFNGVSLVGCGACRDSIGLTIVPFFGEV